MWPRPRQAAPRPAPPFQPRTAACDCLRFTAGRPPFKHLLTQKLLQPRKSNRRFAGSPESLPSPWTSRSSLTGPSFNQAIVTPLMATKPAQGQRPQVQPCRYKTGKTLGAGSYSVVKECVHIDSGRYYAAKVINKRLMAGREHMV